MGLQGDAVVIGPARSDATACQMDSKVAVLDPIVRV